MTLVQADPLAVQSSLADLSAQEFAAIAGYAHQTFGLHLPQSKREMVFARLIKRLRRTGIASFADYLAFVQREENSAERSEFLSALTTNVTQFFRESHHFDELRQRILPPLIARARKGQRVRLWSAGCSSGQEAYSMAMTILDQCSDAPALDIKILATDIDPRILYAARAGIYAIDDLPSIPESLRRFTSPGPDAAHFAMQDAPRQLISFAELNLIRDWPLRGPFDVIFCRNVAIYFDQETQRTLWAKFADLIAEGGSLMIGHSERLTGPASSLMRNAGVTIYVKTQNYHDKK